MSPSLQHMSAKSKSRNKAHSSRILTERLVSTHFREQDAMYADESAVRSVLPVDT